MYLSRVTKDSLASAQLSRSAVFALLLVAVIGFGVFLRIFHLLFIPLELPYRFGGLFVEFSHQIVENDFRLPERIPFYSEGGIPFAYSPLPFYVLAALSKLLPVSEIELVNVLPPVVGGVGVIAFYGLTGAFRLNRRAALGAVAVFAVLPSAYKEVLYGDGLAESFGLLAIILFAASFRVLAEQRTLRSAVITGISGGFCILTSPGSAIGAVVTGVLFSAFSLSTAPARKYLRAVLLLGVVALAAAATASPYLVPISENHGIGILFRTVSDHYEDSPLFALVLGLETLLAFSVSDGGYFHWFWDTLILFSLLYSLLAWRDWLVPAWLVASLLVPREGIWLASVPVALVAGRFIANEALPFLKRAVDSTLFNRRDHFLKFGVFAAVVYLTLHVVYLLLANPGWGDVSHGGVPQDPISPETVDALDWGRDNLPSDARVIVVYNGNVEDWAPHLLRRTVVNMAYGTEWEPDERRDALALNEALYSCANLGCVMDVTSAHTIPISSVYLFLSRAYLEAWLQDDGENLATIHVVFSNDDAAFVQIHPQTVSAHGLLCFDAPVIRYKSPASQSASSHHLCRYCQKDVQSQLFGNNSEWTRAVL